MLPIQDVLIISLFLSAVLAVLYRVLTKPAELRALKAEVAHYKEEMNKAQKAGDKERADKFMKEMLSANKKQMGHNMKPMVASMVLFFIALGWLGGAYSEMALALPFAVPFIASFNWFWWYLVIVIPATQLFRKLLGVD